MTNNNYMLRRLLLTTIIFLPFLVSAQLTVNAGIDQTILLPDNFCTLYGGKPFSKPSAGARLTSFVWSQVSGPNTATFSRYADSAVMINSLDSAVFVSNMVEGVYTFQVTVKDSKGATASDQVKITIKKCVINPNPKTITFTTTVYAPIDAGTKYGIMPGTTILLDGNKLKPEDQIVLGGIQGCPTQPVIVKAINKKVNIHRIDFGNTGYGPGYNRVSYTQLDGSTIPGEKYGIRVQQVVGYTVDHFEVNNVEVINSYQSAFHFGGYEQGANPDPARMFPAFYQSDIFIHDNYVDSTFQEGLYGGSTSIGPGGWDQTGMPPYARSRRMYVYNNTFRRTGRDGIQISSCAECKVFNNLVELTGLNGEYGQGSAINFGTGSSGEVTGNVMRRIGNTASFINGHGKILYAYNYIDSPAIKLPPNSTWPSVIYTDGSPVSPEAMKPQQLSIIGNVIRIFNNGVRAIFSNDYTKIAGPTEINKNVLVLPPHYHRNSN